MGKTAWQTPNPHCRSALLSRGWFLNLKQWLTKDSISESIPRHHKSIWLFGILLYQFALDTSGSQVETTSRREINVIACSLRDFRDYWEFSSRTSSSLAERSWGALWELRIFLIVGVRLGNFHLMLLQELGRLGVSIESSDTRLSCQSSQ